MSRIGKAPISLPSGVNVSVDGDMVIVKGPKGQLSQALVGGITLRVESDVLHVERPDEQRESRAYHGLVRSLLYNMVAGVTQGFTKELQVLGIGYRADVKGSELVLNLGYSHPIHYPVPEGITIVADKQNKITVSGIDKQRVSQVAANIRDFRKPDSYKGKGVRYVDEVVRLKAGKTA